MRWVRGYRVNVVEEEAKGGLHDIIDGFFGVVGGAVDKQKNMVLGGFKVRSSLKMLLNTLSGKRVDNC
jgi:hypothetical protein